MKLNREQHMASLPGPGVMLVIAGAGTGKTSALVEKAKNLIGSGMVRAENMLILTFSRKAADEIAGRIVARAGGDASGITSGTFHSFCYRLIAEHRRHAPGNGPAGEVPRIIAQEDADRIIDGLIRRDLEQFRGLPVPVIRQLLEGTIKFDKAICRTIGLTGIREKLEELRRSYRDCKDAGNMMDFSDLMKGAINLLETDARFRGEIVARYRYLLVDEFQDTSGENFRLLKLLLPATGPNLFAVGDDWQSIYGFRDARIEYIVNMRKHFPGVKIVKLRTNYRSHREIVDLSGRFIGKNRFRTSKKLVSHAGRGGLVRAYAVSSRREEASRIGEILSGAGGDAAVLYRNNWQGDIIREMLGPAVEKHGARLMTMHSSKGLEFSTVIVAGISDRIIPDRSADIEEERRLFYVALTRAKRNLYLIYHVDENGGLPVFARELGVRPARFSGAS